MSRRREQEKHCIIYSYPVTLTTLCNIINPKFLIFHIAWSRESNSNVPKFIQINHPNENYPCISFHHHHQSCMITEVNSLMLMGCGLVCVLAYDFDVTTIG
jgi:hypothetical protein